MPGAGREATLRLEADAGGGVREGDDTAAWTLPYFPHTDTIAGNASDCVQVRSARRWGVENRTARTASGGGGSPEHPLPAQSWPSP